MRAWLRTHPAAGFILLAYGISYLIGFPLLLVLLKVTRLPPPLPTYVSRIFVVYGPGLAALILAAIRTGDGSGPRLLLRSLRPRMSDLPWTIAVLAGAAIAALLALLARGVSLGHVREVVSAAYPLLIANFALQVVIVAVGEELGWRGWLLPALLQKMTRLRATAALAVVWGLWHLPLLLSTVTTTVMLLLGVAGFSTLFTWLWVRTGQRLFVVAVAHAAVNTPAFFWEQAGGGAPDQILGFWYTLETIAAMSGLLLVFARWRWWQSMQSVGRGVI